jgi:hypothetical protein
MRIAYRLGVNLETLPVKPAEVPRPYLQPR